VPKVQKLADITDNVKLIALDLRNTLIWEDAAKVGMALDAAQKAREEVAEKLEALTPTITSIEGRQRLATVIQTRTVYLPAQQQFADPVCAGNSQEAEGVLIDEMGPAQLAHKKARDELKDSQIRHIAATVKEGEAVFAQAKLLMFDLLAGMGLAGAWLGCWITRSITRPMNEAVAEKVAAGDLGSRCLRPQH